MMKKSRLFLVMAIGAAALIGCSKDDDSSSSAGGTTTPKTNTDHLASGPWKIVAAVISPPVDTGGGPITNIFDLFFEACDKDDLTTFNADGTGMDDEGADKCDPTDPQTESFNWSFIDNETKLVTDYGNNDRDTVSIASLSSTEVIFTNTDSINGVLHTLTFTGRH